MVIKWSNSKVLSFESKRSIIPKHLKINTRYLKTILWFNCNNDPFLKSREYRRDIWTRLPLNMGNLRKLITASLPCSSIAISFCPCIFTHQLHSSNSPFPRIWDFNHIISLPTRKWNIWVQNILSKSVCMTSKFSHQTVMDTFFSYLCLRRTHSSKA